METMASLADPLSKITKIELSREEYDKLRSVTPWFNYHTSLPVLPLPRISERPHIETERLVVRPIIPSDLKGFHELRKRSETQNHSPSRGKPDRDLEETRQNIEKLQCSNQKHWYFGAFLQRTGEMIGEGGISDSEMSSKTGWPEAEFLLKPEYWRQGYGSELFRAIIDSWWDLPREKRRTQLAPVLYLDKEPGAEVVEGLCLPWEQENEAARNFFAKILGQNKYPVSAEGRAVMLDDREGSWKEGTLVNWMGTVTINPRTTLD